MSIWCDKLASLPTVGIKLDTHFAPSEIIANALTPITDALVNGDKAEFIIEAPSDAFGFSFVTGEGYKYGFGAASISVSFQHRANVKQRSADVPTFELLSNARPYSELIPLLHEKVLIAADHVIKLKPRKLIRVGVVSITTANREDLPPGILAAIDRFGRPWKSGLDSFAISLTAVLSRDENSEDRCIYKFSSVEHSDGLIEVNLDMQRTFKNPRSATKDNIKACLGSVTEAAYVHFEDVAIGGMFDV